MLQQNEDTQSQFLEKKQIALKTKIDQQQGQITEIQKELNSLPPNADTHYINKNFTNLKVFISFEPHYNIIIFTCLKAFFLLGCA